MLGTAIALLLSVISAIIISTCWSFEYYEIVDQDLFVDHLRTPDWRQHHHHLLGNFSSCEEARPYVKLSRHSWDTNHSRSRLDPERLQHGHLIHLVKNNAAVPSNATDPLMTTSIGWLDFTIYDVIINKEDTAKSLLCYDGQVHQYDSQRCNEEDYRGSDIKRTEFFGGNGYDFHMYSEGKARYWSPVKDNRDGTYSVRIRIDDPAIYKIDILLNNRKGCHFADCDTPRELCDTFKPYGPRMEYCKVDNNCIRVVHSVYVNVTDTNQWPPYKVKMDNLPAYSLPNCSMYEMGSMNGRWLDPQYMKERYRSHITPFHSPIAPHPYVWQPYDCQLHWMSVKEVQSCSVDKEFILSGFSRERTNFFDIFDLQERPIAYARYMNTDTVDNINYFTVYFAQLVDKKYWNHNGQLARTISWISEDLRNNGLCMNASEHATLVAKLEHDMATAKNANYAHQVNNTLQCVLASQHLKMVFLLTEEDLWITEVGLKSIWSGLSRDFIAHLKNQCSNATLVYKGATSLRSQYGSLSWQRMYQASRLSIANARALELPVLDSFIMTHPWIMDKQVFPDGLHLYSNTKFQGNWVSKTTTMIFLQQVCSK